MFSCKRKRKRKQGGKAFEKNLNVNNDKEIKQKSDLSSFVSNYGPPRELNCKGKRGDTYYGGAVKF